MKQLRIASLALAGVLALFIALEFALGWFLINLWLQVILMTLLPLSLALALVLGLPRSKSRLRKAFRIALSAICVAGAAVVFLFFSVVPRTCGVDSYQVSPSGRHRAVVMVSYGSGDDWLEASRVRMGVFWEFNRNTVKIGGKMSNIQTYTWLDDNTLEIAVTRRIPEEAPEGFNYEIYDYTERLSF